MIKQSLLGQIGSMKEFFDRSTRVLSEEDSGFAPAPGMFTVAQQVAHTAQTIEWFMHGAFAESGFDLDFERMDKEVRAVDSLSAAREWLDRAFESAKTKVEDSADSDWTALLPAGPILGGLPKYAIMGALTDHCAHHRGALTVYSRLLKKVPPMPYMDM